VSGQRSLVGRCPNVMFPDGAPRLKVLLLQGVPRLIVIECCAGDGSLGVTLRTGGALDRLPIGAGPWPAVRLHRQACDISAIRNYAVLDPRVNQLLRYTLNFYCGGVSEFGKTMDYVRKVGLSEEDVSYLRYRGDGCPGPMIIRSHGGEVFSFSYNEMWDDENRWQLQFRCKICPDSLGDLADVTVADVWPGGRPDTEGLGFNGFIARTKRGLRLIETAIRDGAIKITEALGYDGLELAQGSHMVKKQAITSRLAAMRDAGLIVPRFINLRLDEAAALTDEVTRQANYDGMRDRLRRGDNQESLPAIGAC